MFTLSLIHEGYALTQDGDMAYSPSFHGLYAMGQAAAFQILIQADEPFVLTLGDAPAFAPQGMLPTLRLPHPKDGRLLLEGLIPDDDGTPRADLLLPCDGQALPAGRHAVWAEVDLPRDPGLVEGILPAYVHTGFGDEQVIACLSYRLDVLPVTLPTPQQNGFHLDLWQHVSNIARKHDVPRFSGQHFAVLENYVKSLADLGQKAVTVIASEIPWSGQRCFQDAEPSDLYEYSMIGIQQTPEGFVYDYSVMDRYIRLCFAHGVDQEIEVFGLSNIWMDEAAGFGAPSDFPDGVRLRYRRLDGGYAYLSQASQVDAYIVALQAHFQERGWLEKVRVVADEPADVALYRARLAHLKAVAPGFALKTCINHAEFIEEFHEEVLDFVPSLPCVTKQWPLLRRLIGSVPGRICWYVCCQPAYPNTFLRSPRAESVLIGWITALTGMDGFLRWNYTVWPDHPRQRISYRAPDWSAGDTCFVYPGNDGAPLLTPRYKLLKRGMEDYALLQQLRQRPGGEELLHRLAEGLLRCQGVQDFDYTQNDGSAFYSTDYADYIRARESALTALAYGIQ